MYESDDFGVPNATNQQPSMLKLFIHAPILHVTIKQRAHQSRQLQKRDGSIGLEDWIAARQAESLKHLASQDAPRRPLRREAEDTRALQHD